jgi:predicted AAA+ superfamily ATPase
VRRARKMLMVLAEQPPQTPNLSRLASELNIDRKQCARLMRVLEKGGLLALLGSDSDNLKNLSRPDKIYCDNPNLMAALVPAMDVGTLRECFFVNQLRKGHKLEYPQVGDVLVDGKWLFEIGGRKKSFNQIKDIPDSYLAIADTETGRGNRIPIWMFGLLY